MRYREVVTLVGERSTIPGTCPDDDYGRDLILEFGCYVLDQGGVRRLKHVHDEVRERGSWCC
jgi:hypothetical protein